MFLFFYCPHRRTAHHTRADRVAIVFCPEDMSLSNQNLELCNEVVSISTAEGVFIVQPVACSAACLL